MFDPVQVQDDLVAVLLSADSLSSVQVLSYRKKRLQNELNYRTYLTTPRNGRCGAFVMVAMPTAQNPRPNVAGPVLDWVFPVVSIEEPNMNFHTENGTNLSAEEIAQRVLDVLHQYSDGEGARGLTAENPAIAMESEFVFKGCIGYRTSFRMTGKSQQTPRCGAVTISVVDGVVSMACATAGAQVWLTVDGSTPSTHDGNAAAVAYGGPFPAASGTVVRAAAYKAGTINSALRRIVVP